MIYFASRTGNVRYIVSCLSAPAVEIQAGITAHEPFLLFTYTDGFNGRNAVPKLVDEFVKRSHKLCKGIIVSGNRNFGPFYGVAGDILTKQYNVPTLMKIDLRGTPTDLKVLELYYEKKVINGEEAFTAQ